MEQLSVRATLIVALLVVLATDVLYVVVIRSQGPSPDPYLPFIVSGYLVLMAALIGLSLIPTRWVAALRVPLRVTAALGLLAIGFLAVLTIGVLFIVAALFVIASLILARRTPATTSPHS